MTTDRYSHNGNINGKNGINNALRVLIGDWLRENPQYIDQPCRGGTPDQRELVRQFAISKGLDKQLPFVNFFAVASNQQFAALKKHALLTSKLAD